MYVRVRVCTRTAESPVNISVSYSTPPGNERNNYQYTQAHRDDTLIPFVIEFVVHL